MSKPKPQVVDDGLSTKARLDAFVKELNEFESNFNKLFNGKDPANFMQKLSVIKETKNAEETFKKLNEEMKVSNHHKK